MALNGRNPVGLIAYNAQRTAEAGPRNAHRARAALDSPGGPFLPPEWQRVAQARADHPAESWAQIGARLGVTRYVAASVFRRMMLAVYGD